MNLIYDSHITTAKRISNFKKLGFLGLGIFALLLAMFQIEWRNVTISDVGNFFIVSWSLLLSVQAILFLRWILHAWNDPEEVEKFASPKTYIEPHYSFSALLPVRNEEAVIGDTIKAIENISYPGQMKELLVLVRSDDEGTIAAAQKAISGNTRIVVVDDLPVNKPNQLNWGLREAKNDIVVVFDAEDQPHADIYNIANTTMQRDRLDVLQSGVQLVNYKSKWFSVLNCLEYYFWFKSALLWFAQHGVVPLGGNTVFFKRYLLGAAGGWDESCLTEDGEVGIRLSSMGARIGVVYDERHATQEETPTSLKSFIAQRTRWNLGFLQIFSKGLWKKLPTRKQRILAGYLLVLPCVLAFVLLVTPLLAALSLTLHLPMIVAMITFLPMIFMAIQIGVLLIGLWQFAYTYFKQLPILASLVLLLGVVPYFILLAIGALRAIVRYVSGNRLWEKTVHINAHRSSLYVA